MLEHSQTMLLVKKAQNGDEYAKNILLEHNSPLIKSIVKRYIGKGVEYDDLYQLGCVGFLKAINNFDYNYDVKFSTYAVPMIAGEIKRFLRDDGSIKVSRAIKGLAYQIQKYIDANKENYSKITIEAIAQHFNMSVADVVFAQESSKMPISMNEKIDNDSSNSPSIMDKLVQSDTTEERIDKIVLKELIEQLPLKDKKIIILRYFRDKTQSEVAELLRVSQVQVSRLENRILQKMKSKFDIAE